MLPNKNVSYKQTLKISFVSENYLEFQNLDLEFIFRLWSLGLDHDLE
jgi:hypothetical protein